MNKREGWEEGKCGSEAAISAAAGPQLPPTESAHEDAVLDMPGDIEGMLKSLDDTDILSLTFTHSIPAKVTS